MRKVNFNALKNVSAPESWVEKALHAKPKKKPIFLRPYFIGTAASVVVVSAVVLTLLIHLGGNTPLSPKTDLFIQPSTVALSENDDTTMDNSATQDKAETTSNDTVSFTQAVDSTAAASITSTETDPLEKGILYPTQGTQTTSLIPTNPTTVVSDPVVTTAPQPSQPDEKPTEAETTAPTPKKPPLQITDVEYLAEPSEPDYLPGVYQENISLLFSEYLDGSKSIYCHIICNGLECGELYSDNEKMIITDSKWGAATYCPLSRGISLLYESRIDVIFYDESGKAFRFRNLFVVPDLSFMIYLDE